MPISQTNPGHRFVAQLFDLRELKQANWFTNEMEVDLIFTLPDNDLNINNGYKKQMKNNRSDCVS